MNLEASLPFLTCLVKAHGRPRTAASQVLPVLKLTRKMHSKDLSKVIAKETERSVASQVLICTCLPQMWLVTILRFSESVNTA